MRLSGPQRQKLQNALIEAFLNKTSLEQMLLFELEKNLDTITGEGNLEVIVFNLIKTAEAQGWIENLIRAAHKSNPGNTRLRALAQELISIYPETPSVSLHNKPLGQSTQPQKILILTAIPHELHLDKQMREIRAAIERTARRDLFEIKQTTAVCPQDIRRALADERPEIVHFCGQGLENGFLVLEDDSGNHLSVSSEGLAALFKLHANYIKCVLLNVCYSSKLAEAIGKHINYVIGMNQPIEDRAAIIFVQGFYDGLGYDTIHNLDLIKRAFDEGIVAIKLENLLQSSIPVLWEWGITHEQPESIVKGTSECQNNDSASNRRAQIPTPKFHEQLAIETNKKVIEPQQPLPIKQDNSEDILRSEKGIDYTKLRDLLAAEKWKQADQETLAVMLKIAGREKDGWLNVRSINNFPCTDLRTIDRLWVNYSNKKFGFSVQKQIWQNVSADIFSEEAWVSFGECIGWRTTKFHQILFDSWTTREWSDYSESNFNLDAPHGHLPRMWDKWRGGFEVAALLMRVENCNLECELTQIDFDINPTGPIDNLCCNENIDYTRLQNFLASRKWKEADRETFAVMLKVAKREKEGWLNIESINNFSCTDLHTIDQLWVKYSNGQFGFSVQNSIWQEVGGKVDIETECRLGDRLGWRVNNKWLSYSDLIFTTNAPHGHLPICWWDMYFMTTGSPGTSSSSLMFKLQKCNIK
jgi:hypothetical protein